MATLSQICCRPDTKQTKDLLACSPTCGSVRDMPLTKVDEKGRVVLPSDLRRRLGINIGDEFLVDELGPDSLVLKKIDLRSLMEDIIEKAKGIDMDKLEAEIEEEANRLARRKYKILD